MTLVYNSNHHHLVHVPVIADYLVQFLVHRYIIGHRRQPAVQCVGYGFRTRELGLAGATCFWFDLGQVWLLGTCLPHL